MRKQTTVSSGTKNVVSRNSVADRQKDKQNFVWSPVSTVRHVTRTFELFRQHGLFIE